MSYLAQRLLHGAGVVLGVSLIVFGLTWLRGDPTTVLVPLNTPPAEIERLRHELGLDRPLPVQYVDFLSKALRGDFGSSLRLREPALPLLLDRLPATMLLVSTALLFAVLVGVPLGVIAATQPGKLPDLLARLIALLGQSLAAPWVGLMLILIFAVRLRWLPSSGLTQPAGLILPAIVAGLYPMAGLIRLLRSGMLEQLTADYVRAVRAKGLPERLVLVRHALRNATLPTLTFIGVQLGFLFSNSVVAEAIFAYPGMGRLAVEAIGARDLPLIQAFVAVAAVVVVLASLLVDTLYVWLDPRVRRA
ncbi:MAG TPA: ABC transporter permease [Chloroflexota bacterium]|jgi:peptide/nickel transport system permease protein|nr:ABC transporter permease [Chloroflexota bacterium]